MRTPRLLWLAALGALFTAIVFAGCLSSSNNALPDGGLVNEVDAGDAAAAPLVSVSTSGASFGTVALGASSSPTAIVITNSGNAVTGALSVVLGGAQASAFVIDSDTCLRQTLAPNDTCTVALHFAPATAGTDSATLTISASPGGSVSVAITGTAAAAGSLSVTPTSAAFTAITTGSTSPVTTFTLSSTGAASGALAVALTGTDAAQFAFQGDACTGTSLAAGGTCTVGVVFAPTVAGVKSATLSITATGGTASASLTGTALVPGAPAKLAWGAASYDAGTTATTTSTTLVLANTGSSASGVPAFVASGTNAGDFTVGGTTCDGGVPAGASCNVTLSFTPKTKAAESATLTATSTPGGSAATSVVGAGAVDATLSISPSPKDLGTVVQGAAGSPVLFTIKNVGGITAGTTATPLTLSTTTGNATDVVLTGSTCGATLAPLATCTVNATFHPTSTGAEATTLQATATPGITGTASLTGTSLSAGALAIDHSSNTFTGVLETTTSGAFVFTVSNVDQGPTTALAVSIVGGAGSPFKIASDTCQGVALAGAGSAGSTCAIGVTFTPPNATPQTDTLKVTAATGGTVTSALSGTGLTPAALTLTSAAGTSVPFGSYIDGVSSSAITFTVKNTGTQASGPVGFNFGGADQKNFAVVSTNCPTAAPGLAGGATCTAGIVFTPTSVGAESATVTASATPGGTTAAIALTGTGYSAGPELQISPASLTLPNVVGTYTLTETFTVTNVGGAATGAITDMISGINFTTIYDSCTGNTLASGASCLIGASFSTTATKPNNHYIDTIVVSEPTGSSDSVTATYTATVTGTSSIDVAIVPSGNGACIRNDAGIIDGPIYTFTVTNNGAAVTGALSLDVAIPFRGQFVMLPGQDKCTGASLAPNGSCSFQLQYDTPQCSGSNSLVVIKGAAGIEVDVGISASIG